MSLARRAKVSGDGEAYAVLTKARGYRVGIGARKSPTGEPTFFVEVVLDPLPDRPDVEPAHLGDQAALLAKLQRRGYRFTCDDAGCITCERTMRRASAVAEARELDFVLSEAPRKRTPASEA